MILHQFVGFHCHYTANLLRFHELEMSVAANEIDNEKCIHDNGLPRLDHCEFSRNVYIQYNITLLNPKSILGRL